jgi:hypothetical protein
MAQPQHIMLEQYVREDDAIDVRRKHYCERRRQLLDEQSTYRAQIRALLQRRNVRALPVLLQGQLMVMRLKTQHSTRALQVDKIMAVVGRLTCDDCVSAQPPEQAIASAILRGVKESLTVKSDVATVEDYLINDRLEAEARARQLGDAEVRLAHDFVRVAEQLRSLQDAQRAELLTRTDAHKAVQAQVIQMMRDLNPETMVQPVVKRSRGETRQYFLRFKQSRKAKTVSIKALQESEALPSSLRAVMPADASLEAALQTLQGGAGVRHLRALLTAQIDELRRLGASVQDKLHLDRGHLMSEVDVANSSAVMIEVE